MKRKGISPLIAAVLLIAFTMAVASLFAQWAPQLIQNAQGDTSNQTEEIQACSTVSLEIVDANASVVTVRQATGDTAAGNVSVTWFYGDSDPLQKFADLTGTGSAERVAIDSYKSDNNALSEVRAQAQECEGAGSATYTPPTS